MSRLSLGSSNSGERAGSGEREDYEYNRTR
jgi:hypothetical protein